jgi:hypothetical protein
MGQRERCGFVRISSRRSVEASGVQTSRLKAPLPRLKVGGFSQVRKRVLQANTAVGMTLLLSSDWDALKHVQHGPAMQELLGELGVFGQGGIEEALVGGEDDDKGEGDYRPEEKAADQPKDRGAH